MTEQSNSRRHFFKTTLLAGAGLTLGMRLGQALADDAPMAGPGEAGSTTLKQGLFAPNAFIRIAPDNTVTVIIKHLEMGQGTHTGLSTLVAEELGADWSQIRAEGAPADNETYKNLAFGSMGTGGSTSMANSYLQMRQAGAAAREMLKLAAARKWGVDERKITVSNGILSHAGTGFSATFGEMAELAAGLPVPENVALKSPEDFVLIGKNNLRRLDAEAKSNGTAIYTQDIRLPDMLVAVVAHPPRFGAAVQSVDDSAAREVRGVVNVVQYPNGVAVLANDFWSAKKGRDALKITWDTSRTPPLDSEALMARYKSLARLPGVKTSATGDVDAALKDAARVISAAYEFPYLAHAAMEPLNCVAQITDEGCEIWNGEQFQAIDQASVAAVLGIEPSKVRINTLYAGGSFGRRANPHADYVLEAVQIAKASGLKRPVKMVWTREEDMRGGHYRPMFYHRIEGGLDENGNLTGWRQRVVGQSIVQGTPMEAMMAGGFDPMSVEGSAEPYEIPNRSVELHTPDDFGVPVQWWRSVGHTHTGFATECFIDELAHAAGRDPVEFRRALMKDSPRHLGVLNLAAEKAGWGNRLPAGRGRGIAVVKSFNTYVAEVADVTVKDDGSFTVDRVVVAVDCGVAVNPDVIYAQMGGGVGFGLSSILGEKITLKEGQVVQSNFHDYMIMRMPQMPQVEVHIVHSGENPSGVGEPGVPPVGPAVANALFAVTGKRIYQLPIANQLAA
ncbi:MAG TPA: xanthine dehydrogenase family protein molybdopterin-binding subunit [Thiolinea sp.]|nr:xanthine dehydrogenase family protein molybdopterin-binding subunit [Thiolinea sp.]